MAHLFIDGSASICRYSEDLHSAKDYLKIIESNLTLQPHKYWAIPLQRKTTLEWDPDGELSSIDKARIFSLLSESELTQCELDCEAA